MWRYFLSGLLLIPASLLVSCASDQSTAADNPYQLEQPGTTAHGEVSAAYGHSVGH